MSKQMTCDFCDSKSDVTEKSSYSRPEGWGSISISLSAPGRYGRMEFRKDICYECADKRFPEKQKEKDRRKDLLDMLDDYISEGVQAAMEDTY